MTSFPDFLSTFDPDAGKRGKQFEHFIKWFLKNDPEWEAQVEEVWLWNDYPGQWGRDKGIDLVFKDKNGNTWAVQAKCYSPNYEITKADVDKFLSESNRKQIHHRLLIATTDGLGVNAREVLEAQEKPVVRYLLNHFEDAKVDYPGSIKELAAGKRKPPPDPRPHQIEAVESIISGFQATDRGQVVMACGTGKTFVCLWVKERLKAKKTLVLLPSLGLLSQTLNEWTFAARDKFDALCVCSDQTVNRRDGDEAINLVSDLPFPVANDVGEIAEFMKRKDDQVVFSTYQSSPLIGQAQKNSEIAQFDLVIADEAHRVAGKNESPFQTVLFDHQIRSQRRLFATATPRIYKVGLKKAAEEFGAEVVDMNDEERFGKRFHTLTFGEAIKRELLTDYRVLIVGVDNDRTKEWIDNRLLVTTATGLATDAKSLAAQVGLLKAIKDWDLRRLISFHGRVKRAKEFSEDIIKIGEWLDVARRPARSLWADHVSGEMPTNARRQKLKRLKNVDKDEIGLLSNARCLSEGVDVPALDGVAFIDPRSGEIDIIQSVGRAIRLSDRKTMGTIVIPVFIERSDNAEEVLESSEFKPIWNVLEALKSHDDRLSDELDQLRIELGAKRRLSVGAGDLTKIVFDLPTSVNEEFAQSLRTHLVEQTTESWMFWFGILETFVARHGHCRVRALYTTEDGDALGSWVATRRYLKNTTSLERRQGLEALPGWSWDPYADQWEEGISQLQEFFDREGHCRVPGVYTTADGYRLGLWVGNQRADNETMNSDRRQRLEALPGWSWDVKFDKWEKGFAKLQEFSDREGHCRVPDRYKTVDGYSLGTWVHKQRDDQDKMSVERRQRLEKLPGWSWDVNFDKWEKGFAKLQEFSDREGHCRVPGAYTIVDGYNLGFWVGNQRAAREKMDPDRRKRLDALPDWSWDVTFDKWEEGFAKLQEFSDREGHCRVPATYSTGDGYSLGAWVKTQRTARETMDSNRSQRLHALPDWSWDPHTDQWEEGFAQLQEFSGREGHCRVPQRYKTGDGYRLGLWVANQRAAREKMDPDRRKRLEALAIWSWDLLAHQWEEGFAKLQEFSDREGHCRVPATYSTGDGYSLGAWVSRQREAKDRVDPDRRQRLEALPVWSWDALADKWEERFAQLKEFSEREGHCRVPQGYKTGDGYRLGGWVSRQRELKDRMDPDRRKQLEASLGWVWKVEK
jgi:superfamily II DNA or RNA helicase